MKNAARTAYSHFRGEKTPHILLERYGAILLEDRQSGTVKLFPCIHKTISNQFCEFVPDDANVLMPIGMMNVQSSSLLIEQHGAYRLETLEAQPASNEMSMTANKTTLCIATLHKYSRS